MTLTRTNLGTLADTANATTYTTSTGVGSSGAIAGSANQFIVAYVVLSDTITPSVPTVTGTPWGVATWTKRQDILAGTGTERLCVFTGTTGGSAPGSASFDIDASSNGGNQTGCIIRVEGYTDDSGSAPTYVQSVTAGPTTSGTPSVTLAALGASSWVIAAFMIGRAPAGTPDTGWTKLYDTSYATPNNGMWVISSEGVTSDNTPSGTWSSGSWVGIGVEIAVPTAVTRSFVIPRRRGLPLMVR